MLLAADAATGQTFALLATFIGIGILVNVLIIYIIAQVLGERKQNPGTSVRYSHLTVGPDWRGLCSSLSSR